ncbi:HAD family hydrolase [Desulfosporosinus sp. BICA1-9]|uniref:HAD family hydrolase n=1 Tax=Desulfosporosinus sp. BICA1-9 TaxID=1531958 RepID=UPI00054BAC2D|nr:HAD hydrolase family protein [Desulfosporosinus sp. BICA1-9]KJS47478.1 MAG: ATPase P [Peptococcaceae bacterium BRH_c23]KJS79574.1 MAG: ATPase P [Desulfosporosinus sp. BICA1-9]HBW39003.1 ATPase P [Desulfosporosinus sp.]
MIQVAIPGRGDLNLEVLILDYNGTLALDGQMFESVKESLNRLSAFLEIHVITSDTFGSVEQQCEGLPVQVKVLETIDHTQEKAAYLLQFDSREVVAIGNGANDQVMLEKANLGIAVIGLEGASLQTLKSADLVVNKIEDGFGLLLKTQRLKATLRR